MKAKEVALSTGIAILSSYFVWELVDLFFENGSSANFAYHFYIYAAVGLIMVFVGLFLQQNVLASGIMFGGVLIIAASTLWYVWGMHKITRLIVIFLELVLLIYISMKKFRK